MQSEIEFRKILLLLRLAWIECVYILRLNHCVCLYFSEVEAATVNHWLLRDDLRSRILIGLWRVRAGTHLLLDLGERIVHSRTSSEKFGFFLVFLFLFSFFPKEFLKFIFLWLCSWLVITVRTSLSSSCTTITWLSLICIISLNRRCRTCPIITLISKPLLNFTLFSIQFCNLQLICFDL